MGACGKEVELRTNDTRTFLGFPLRSVWRHHIASFGKVYLGIETQVLAEDSRNAATTFQTQTLRVVVTLLGGNR